VLEIDRLHSVFPNAQFIHIIRDGRDVSLSLLKKRWQGTTTANTAQYWSKYVSRGVELGRKLPSHIYMEIHYEDLVLNTEDSLKKICRFLNLDFDSKMLTFHENAEQNIVAWEVQHHKKTMRPPMESDVYRWKRESNLLQLIVFEAVAGKTLELVGYERKNKGLVKIFLYVVRIQLNILQQVLSFKRKLASFGFF